MKYGKEETVETWDVEVTRDYPTGDGTHTPMGYLVEWVTVATEISERHHAEDTAQRYLERHEYRAARLVLVCNVTIKTRAPGALLMQSGGKT